MIIFNLLKLIAYVKHWRKSLERRVITPLLYHILWKYIIVSIWFTKQRSEFIFLVRIYTILLLNFILYFRSVNSSGKVLILRKPKLSTIGKFRCQQLLIINSWSSLLIIDKSNFIIGFMAIHFHCLTVKCILKFLFKNKFVQVSFNDFLMFV